MSLPVPDPFPLLLPLLRWAVAPRRSALPLSLAALLLVGACGTGDDPESAATPAPTALTGTSAPPLASPVPDTEDPLSPRPALESPAPTGQPVCEPAAVTVTDADAIITDRVEEVFVLRTRGRPCQLEGFPSVTLLDSSGRALPLPVSTSRAEPEPVTLSAGTSLSFTLTTARTGRCVQAATIRVVLPGTTRPVSGATELIACDAVKTGPVTRLQDDEDEGAGH